MPDDIRRDGIDQRGTKGSTVIAETMTEAAVMVAWHAYFAGFVAGRGAYGEPMNVEQMTADAITNFRMWVNHG